MAAKMGDVEMVRIVVDTHTSREVKEFLEMRMVLSAAAERGHLGVCVVLVDEVGCLIDGVRDKRNKPQWHDVQQYSGNTGHGEGLTPLFRAVVAGHSRVVSMLLARGANPNHVAAMGGGTPLHYAIAKRHVRCVAAILGCKKVQVDLSLTGPDGRTARELAEFVAASALLPGSKDHAASQQNQKDKEELDSTLRNNDEKNKQHNDQQNTKKQEKESEAAGCTSQEAAEAVGEGGVGVDEEKIEDTRLRVIVMLLRGKVLCVWVCTCVCTCVCTRV
jgi:hypothetical protein